MVPDVDYEKNKNLEDGLERTKPLYVLDDASGQTINRRDFFKILRKTSFMEKDLQKSHLVPYDEFSITLKSVMVFGFFYIGTYYSQKYFNSGFIFLALSLFFYLCFYVNLTPLEKKINYWKKMKEKKDILK